MSKKKFYITTPIYYPSASPHLGTTYCTTLCDIIARGKRLRGIDAYFLTGLDEHGEKIEKNAVAQGLTPQEFVDKIATKFLDLWDVMKIANDDFIRTTEERHVKTVQKIFSKMIENNDVYLSSYTGWYCVHEESYWTEIQAGSEHLCPECGRPLEKKDEACYFYDCKKHLDNLLKLYDDNPTFIVPESRKNEMINTFIKPGLENLCVTRTSFDWGVPVLENQDHVVYVWVDALSNYISALGYLQEDDSKFQKYWQDEDCEIVHVIGADITRFHTIYWPMFLDSLGLRQPDKVFVHGLLMMKDGKMSKSKGNVISAYPLVDRYGVDAVRYYLLAEIPFGENGTFTPEQFIQRINMDLANNLGNLLNRTVSMIAKYFDGAIPEYKGALTPLDGELENLARQTIKIHESLFDDLKVNQAYEAVFNLVSAANKYIEDTAPWALAKDETKTEELTSVMSHLAQILFEAGLLLSPILVTKADKIFDQLGIPREKRIYENVTNFGCLNGLQTHKGEQLFPRLDVEEETKQIVEMMKAPAEKAAA